MAQMSPDSVVLEVAKVNIPAGQVPDPADLWLDVDEQHLPNPLRRKLDANGFRSGLLGAQLPPPLRRVLDHGQAVDQDGQAKPLQADVTSLYQRLHSRAGRRGKILAGPVRDRLVTLLNEEGQIRGETLQQAQCVLALRTYPLGDGRVELELTPEVEYGPPRTRPVGQEGIWQLEVSRKRKVFEPLRMRTTLAAGQTLMITGTPSIKGLGRDFFVDPSSGAEQQTVVLIRLVQTQYDNLFAPEQMVTPVATPGQ